MGAGFVRGAGLHDVVADVPEPRGGDNGGGGDVGLVGCAGIGARVEERGERGFDLRAELHAVDRERGVLRGVAEGELHFGKEAYDLYLEDFVGAAGDGDFALAGHGHKLHDVVLGHEAVEAQGSQCLALVLTHGGGEACIGLELLGGDVGEGIDGVGALGDGAVDAVAAHAAGVGGAVEDGAGDAAVVHKDNLPVVYELVGGDVHGVAVGGGAVLAHICGGDGDGDGHLGAIAAVRVRAVLAGAAAQRKAAADGDEKRKEVLCDAHCLVRYVFSVLLVVTVCGGRVPRCHIIISGWRLKAQSRT